MDTSLVIKSFEISRPAAEDYTCTPVTQTDLVSELIARHGSDPGFGVACEPLEKLGFYVVPVTLGNANSEMKVWVM